MLVYIRDGSAQKVVRTATLRSKVQIKLSIKPSRSIPTPSQPVPALTLLLQAPGRVATGLRLFKPLVWLDLERILAKSGNRTLGAYALTTRPTRRSQALIEPGNSCTRHIIDTKTKQLAQTKIAPFLNSLTCNGNIGVISC